MSKISVKNITEAIEKSTEGKTGVELQSALKNIVKFLNNKNMLSQSSAIITAFEKSIDKKNGIIKMKVKSAAKISDDKKRELEHEMKNKYKAKEIVSHYFEDKNLLGGMKVEVGEDVMDFTYRNKLNQLEKVLIKK